MGIPAFGPDRSPASRIEPHQATGLGTGQHNLRIGTPDHAMQLPRSLLAQLDSLSAGLDADGTDLHAILEVLIDDLAEAVPSFTGLTATMRVNGVAVTFTALAPHAQSTSRASMLLPTADGDSGHSLVFYATSPGAFAELAADARAASGLDGRIVVDGHLPPPAHSDGLDEMAEINQAIGVLIEAGHSPVEATAELERRATDTGGSRRQIATDILRQLPAPEDDDQGPGHYPGSSVPP